MSLVCTSFPPTRTSQVKLVYSREDKRQAGSNADEGQTFLSDTVLPCVKRRHVRSSSETKHQYFTHKWFVLLARLLSDVAGPTTDHWYHAYFVVHPCQSRDHHLLGVWFPSRHGFEYIVPRRSRRSPIDFFASSASLRATSGATSFAYAGRGWGLQPPLRGRGPHFQWASTLRAIPTSLLVVWARLLWCRVGCMVGFWMVSPLTAYCRETRRAIVLWWSLLFMVLDVGTFVASGKENCSVG